MADPWSWTPDETGMDEEATDDFPCLDPGMDADEATLSDAFYEALERFGDEAGERNMPAPTPGQIAYETYFDELENTPPAGSLRWQALEPRERDAWEAAAQAVLALKQEETPSGT